MKQTKHPPDLLVLKARFSSRTNDAGFDPDITDGCVKSRYHLLLQFQLPPLAWIMTPLYVIKDIGYGFGSRPVATHRVRSS